MLQYLLSLSPGTLILIALGFIIVYNAFQVIFDPLRDIPGPFLARFTRLWYLLELYKGRFELTNIELHKKYGAIVRIAPSEYSIDDVESARTIYGHGSSFVKSPWYTVWQPPDPNKATLFSEVSASRHAEQRRKFTSAYSMSSLITYEPFVDNCSNLMIQRFSELAASGKSFDLAHWLQCYAFDVIGELTFGSRFGFLDMGLDEPGVFAAIDAANAYSTHVGVYPQFHKLIYPLISKTGGAAYLGAFNTKQVSNRLEALKDARKKTRPGPPDFLTRFLTAHEENPQKMTSGDLITISHSNLRAGSDTTGITLSGILYHLLKNPATLQRLRKEIDDAAVAGKASDPILFKEAQELPYLQAVIKEGLRLHPAVGLPLARVIPEVGATIAGRNLPAKSTVGINAWVAHRNRSVYGLDADIWRPERWLEIEQEGRGGEVKKYFFAFGMGSRTCIGKNISLLEISKLVPTLVSKFDFHLNERLIGDGRSWKTLSRWFVKQLDLETRVTSR